MHLHLLLLEKVTFSLTWKKQNQKLLLKIEESFGIMVCSCRSADMLPRLLVVLVLILLLLPAGRCHAVPRNRGSGSRAEGRGTERSQRAPASEHGEKVPKRSGKSNHGQFWNSNNLQHMVRLKQFSLCGFIVFKWKKIQ